MFISITKHNSCTSLLTYQQNKMPKLPTGRQWSSLALWSRGVLLNCLLWTLELVLFWTVPWSVTTATDLVPLNIASKHFEDDFLCRRGTCGWILHGGLQTTMKQHFLTCLLTKLISLYILNSTSTEGYNTWQMRNYQSWTYSTAKCEQMAW